ncbi:hypothetical protein KQH52_10195 [Mycetohabitans sp. B7]|nr:hypothetical protein [Mycetohabitans sp. B7]
MHHHRSGMAIRAIARVTALDRRTARYWIHAGEFPERTQRPPATSTLVSIEPILLSPGVKAVKMR